MGKDKRGVERGKCRYKEDNEVCDCDDFELLSADKQICGYCLHAPVLHVRKELQAPQDQNASESSESRPKAGEETEHSSSNDPTDVAVFGGETKNSRPSVDVQKPGCGIVLSSVRVSNGVSPGSSKTRPGPEGNFTILFIYGLLLPSLNCVCLYVVDLLCPRLSSVVE